jgi:mono/diheme cytochrome c family protein
MRIIKLMILAAFTLLLAGGLFALPKPGKTQDGTAAASAQVMNEDEAQLRIAGEQRFRTNCGRCHMAPHKFPPRMMATIVRHMRVRATITDSDMRIILHYLTQ